MASWKAVQNSTIFEQYYSSGWRNMTNSTNQLQVSLDGQDLVHSWMERHSQRTPKIDKIAKKKGKKFFEVICFFLNSGRIIFKLYHWLSSNLYLMNFFMKSVFFLHRFFYSQKFFEEIKIIFHVKILIILHLISFFLFFRIIAWFILLKFSSYLSIDSQLFLR